MNSILRNPELKDVIFKLLIVQIIFALFIFLFARYQLEDINSKVIQRDVALAGKILSRYPELEEEIVVFFTREVSDEEFLEGEKRLAKYGYKLDMLVDSQPILSGVRFVMGTEIATLAFIGIIPILALVWMGYRRIYSKSQKIAHAVERVVDGDFSVDLPEEGEGDFGILGHRFNQMASRLKRSMDRLKEDKVFLKNIISDISHQLKTPLASLIIFNDLMLQDTNMDGQVRVDFLNKSRTQLDRMEWLIISLLKLARLEAGAISFRRDKVFIVSPVRKAVASLDIKAKQKHQVIKITGYEERAWFTGDEEWIEEAFSNIIKNCIEHTCEGGTIEIHLDETPLFSSVSIKDNGEGISREDLPHIFERFYRGSNSVKAGSVGIGLALSRLIVEEQEGVITVKSEKGKGTEFIITFLKRVI